MGQLGRQSIFSFFSSYAGIVLGIVNKVFFFPIIFLGDEKYWGLLELYIAYASIISTLAHIGMPKVIQRFYPGMEDDNKPRFLGYTLLYTIVGYLLLLILLYLGKGFVADWATDTESAGLFFEQYYFLLIVLVTIMVFFDYLSGILISNYRSHLPVFLNNVTFRIGVSLSIGLFYLLDLSLETFMILYIAIYLVNLLIAGIYLAKKKLLNFSFAIGENNRQGYLKFGMFSVMAGTSGWLLSFMDTLFVGHYFLAQVAFLAVAKYITNVMHVPARVVIQASVPVVSKAWKQNDKKQLEVIYKKTALTELLVGGLIFAAIWINIDFILNLFENPGYKSIKYVILVLGMGRMADLATGANSVIIGNSVHYRFSLYANISLVIIAVLLNLWLTPRYGLIGAATALGVAITLNNIAMVYFLWVKEKIQPFTKKHLVLLAFLAGVVLVLGHAFPINVWVDLVLRNLVFLAATAFLIFYYRPVEEINVFIQKMAQRYLGRSS